MTPQQIINKAKIIGNWVDNFKAVIKDEIIEIDTDVFNFTYWSTRGNRNAQTDKEYICNEWTLFAVIDSGASVNDGEVTIYSNCIDSLDLYDINGQEWPLTTNQQTELEQAILKTIL
mgnify:CR=1 FL=1|tara:strand:+ start:203 stop:553 length:351 start_codon:yes stop_codon:yes gene_type:complete